MAQSFSVTGNLVDVFNKTIFPATVVVSNGKISSITPVTSNEQPQTGYILPGFIDSHVHVESSMLVPSEFAKLAVVHGTVGTVSDPHEIANVCGMAGVEFMIDNGKQVNFKFNFGAPSCVPATTFETAGAALDSADVHALLLKDEIKYLSEMMNFPGVLFNDEEVMKKIASAKALGKPVDGHAPGLRGEDARKYIAPPPPKGGTWEAYYEQYVAPSMNANKNTSEPTQPASEIPQIGSGRVYQTADPLLYGLLKTFVKEHRSNPTQAEIVLWEGLRGKKLGGFKFRRQHIIDCFIADFVCLAKKLIIEVDGLIHQLPENIISDKERTEVLNKLGFEVIRFTNDEVLYQTEKVVVAISEKLSLVETTQPASEIPPLGGGGAIISTDHECFTKEEALDKLGYGMKIIIREGSAAKNFEALIDLLHDYPNEILFCSDDKHPDSLMVGHINQLCARAVAKGIDIFNILQAACINPVLHYKLDIGLLRVGDDADFIIADDLVNFNISHTYINGALVAQNGKSFIQSVAVTPINQFDCDAITAEQLAITTNNYPIADGKIPVIEALEGQLITNKLYCDATIVNDILVSNTNTDILKMVVVNRYHNAPVAKAFIKNVGLQQGAIASSVAHDSHNIVAVGVDDESLAQAINLVIQEKGGVSAVGTQGQHVLGLPVAGLMSANDGYQVAATYTAIDAFVKEQLGSTLAAPFMTLSFMALLVIPHLKLSDKGLFDGDSFQFV
jgi:adenine deaminase/very-short-patch-repair endonuclease